MTAENERLLRAMLAAKLAYDSVTREQHRLWGAYMDAQAAFTGKFSSTQYPLGPFVVGETLIEHEEQSETWPPKTCVFGYRDVIRCPTSE